MNGPNCPILERDESKVANDEDVRFINTDYRKEFEFWCREKGD